MNESLFDETGVSLRVNRLKRTQNAAAADSYTLKLLSEGKITINEACRRISESNDCLITKEYVMELLKLGYL